MSKVISAVVTDGDKFWKLEGTYNRSLGPLGPLGPLEEDVPTIEYANGQKEWYCREVLHRVGRPAIVCNNGDKKWYRYGILHRVEGPAIEYANGDKEWWLDGRLLREDRMEQTIIHIENMDNNIEENKFYYKSSLLSFP